VSGELKWQFQTGADANQPVSGYEQDGEQYIAVPTSAGVWAFKLNGTVAPRPAPTVPPEGAGFTGRILPTEVIEIGPEVPDSGLEFIRMAKDEYTFAPLRAKTSAGAKLTWKNVGKETHTISAVDGSWTTGPVEPGKSVTVTAPSAGTHVYVCKEHPWSYGELTVE